MKILETIRRHKISEISDRKSLYPIKLLEKSMYFETQCVSFKNYITNSTQSGIIAEFKRRSPSKGNINLHADVRQVTTGYKHAGASALSILTDSFFFGAKDDDFLLARRLNYCPILRKDFIVDEYQIIESKAMGADAILLIAKLLPAKVINEFTALAHNLGLEVLLETNTEAEILNNYNTVADLVGINNRNLNTFEVTIENSIRLAGLLPESIVKIAESGIASASAIQELRNNGFAGFLIGEYFMRSSDPATTCATLIELLSNED